MNILYTILIGFLVGLVARFLKPGDDKMGFILTTVLGIVGAFVGTFLGQALGMYRPDEPAGFLGATVGAIIVLMIVALISGRRRSIV